MMHAHSRVETLMSNDATMADTAAMQARLLELRQLLQNEDPTDAIYACDRFNRDYPVSGQGFSIASHLALRIKDANAALLAIDRALRIDPTRSDWLLQRANCLYLTGRKSDARALALAMSKRLYPSAQMSSAVALMLSSLGLQREARPLFVEAATLEPNVGGHYYNLATVQRFLGELSEAEVSLDKAIRINPEDVESIALRSGLRTQTTERNHVSELQSVLNGLADKPSHKVAVCYSLAKELEDLERYAESSQILDEGARTRRQHIKYDVQADLQTMAQIQQVFSAERFARGDAGHTDARPIFVIGMPRTGTTLVEQILGSHSVVHAAGELSTFAIQLTNVARHGSPTPIRNRPELISVSGQLDTSELGRAYLDNCPSPVANEAGAYAHFVDKMPMNFLYAGLIHLALPKAKIIHVTRQPMDTCYAVFKTLFQNAYPYSYHLQELAHYFVAYSKLMNHWEQVIPGVIKHVSYEDLVNDPATEIRNLLDFCGLSFEEQCLNFHSSGGTSTTASAVQIRKPIYQESVGRWKHFERELQPALDIIKNAGIAI